MVNELPAFTKTPIKEALVVTRAVHDQDHRFVHRHEMHLLADHPNIDKEAFGLTA
jgi:hypothetical protein